LSRPHSGVPPRPCRVPRLRTRPQHRTQGGKPPGAGWRRGIPRPGPVQSNPAPVVPSAIGKPGLTQPVWTRGPTPGCTPSRECASARVKAGCGVTRGRPAGPAGPGAREPGPAFKRVRAPIVRCNTRQYSFGPLPFQYWPFACGGQTRGPIEPSCACAHSADSWTRLDTRQ
jgi:hypothetical protein